MSVSVSTSVLVMAFAAAGCASNAALQAARDARYQGNRTHMLETVVETVRAGYEVVDVNPETGLVRTRDRWYEKDGTFEDKKANEIGIIVEDGSILLRYEVALRTSGPEYQVEVTPVVAQFRNGYAAPFKIKPDDLAMPGWVQGKTEKLVLELHDALATYRVGPPGSTTAQR